MKEDLILNDLIDALIGKYRKIKVPFWSGLLAGLLAHMFVMTNKLVNHDEVGQLFGKGVTLPSGRWGLDILSFVLPNYSMPWIHGIMSILLIVAAACVIVRILGIQNRVFQGLTSALIITFPSLVGTFSYMFTSSAYAISFFLSCIAVYLAIKKKRICYIVGLVCMVFSLGIYQAYIAIASSLLLLMLLKSALTEEEDALEFFKLGGYYLTFLILSLALYYGITQLCFTITGTTFGDYAAQNLSAGKDSPLLRLKISIAAFFVELFGKKYGLIPSTGGVVFTWIAMASAAIAMGCWCIQKRKLSCKVYAVIILALFPISMNCMFLFTESSSVHTLVLYSFVMLYLLLIVILENTGKAGVLLMGRNILSFCLTAIVAINIYISNEAYLCMHLLYENAYSFYTSLVTEIKQMPEFDENSKIALVGNADNLITQFDEFENVSQIMSVTGLRDNTYTREKFVRYYIGFDPVFATKEEIEALCQNPQFADMPVYPFYGSIGSIGDYIVVKFSEDGLQDNGYAIE